MSGKASPTQVMNTLKAYIAGASTRSLPEAVREKTKQHILMMLACMVSGTQLKPGRVAIDFARKRANVSDSSVPGTHLTYPGEIASFVNGMTARAGECDDVHTRSRAHPGASIIPAALAMAERNGASGDLLIKAVSCGYDVGCRIIPGLGLAHLEDKGFGVHSFGQLWGSAVAAGVLSDLKDENDAAYLLSYAAQQTAGLMSWYNDQELVETCFFMGAQPARDGFWAADMVASGFNGNPNVFDTRFNFQDTYSDNPDISEFIDELGSRFEIMETNLKFRPVGSPIHASLESLLKLRADHGLTPDNVSRIVTQVPARDGVITIGRNSPNINMRHILSLGLIDGDITLQSAHDYARMSDPQVKEVSERIDVKLDDDLQKLMPNRTAIVSVTLTDGSVVTHRTDAIPGTPANPLAQADIEAVATRLIEPVLGAQRAADVVASIRSLETVGNIRDIRHLWMTPSA